MTWEYLSISAPHVTLQGIALPGEHAELRPDVAALLPPYAARGWVLGVVSPEPGGARLQLKRPRTITPADARACPICDEPASLLRFAGCPDAPHRRATHRCQCCRALLCQESAARVPC